MYVEVCTYLRHDQKRSKTVTKTNQSEVLNITVKHSLEYSTYRFPITSQTEEKFGADLNLQNLRTAEGSVVGHPREVENVSATGAGRLQE